MSDPREWAEAMRWAQQELDHPGSGERMETLARALLAAESERDELAREVEKLRGALDDLVEQLEAAHRLLIDLINWSPQTQRGREAMHPQHRAALEAAEVLVATPNPASEPDDSYLDGLNYWHEGGSHPAYVALANVTAVAYNEEREDGDLAAAFGFLRAEIDSLVGLQSA